MFENIRLKPVNKNIFITSDQLDISIVNSKIFSSTYLINFLSNIEKNQQKLIGKQVLKLDNDRILQADSTHGISGSRSEHGASSGQGLAGDDSLTVFLGGAGMVGGYNQDMIEALKEVGIKNPVYGNYSALPQGWDEYIPSFADNLVDATNVVHYNQAPNDSVLFTYKSSNGQEYGVPASSIKDQGLNFSLRDLGVNKELPQSGRFNLIGYSWGANIAAQSALYHAMEGTRIDNLVLIGAPMNKSLKNAVLNNPLIKRVDFIELGNQGDPIYSGMGDNEIALSAPTLGKQMGEGEGHFHYSREDEVGRARRRELAEKLYSYGVR